MHNSSLPKNFTPGWGERLAKVRKHLKKTQAEAGAILGVRNTAISKWEGGGAEGLDERTLTTLETRWGVNPWFISEGQEPMVVQTWNRDQQRAAYEQAVGQRIDGIWVAPANTGMSELFREGDVLHFAAVPELQHRAIVLVAPPRLQDAVHDGVASPRCVVGRAVRIDRPGKSPVWSLYRDDDREHQGSYPSIELAGWALIGEVVGVFRSL